MGQPSLRQCEASEGTRGHDADLIRFVLSDHGHQLRHGVESGGHDLIGKVHFPVTDAFADPGIKGALLN